MGCAVSTPTDVNGPAHNNHQRPYPVHQRPVASVTPQVQPNQQPAQQLNQEPVKTSEDTQPVVNQQQSQPDGDQTTNTTGVVVTKEAIEKYVALDRKIREAEAKNSIKKLMESKKTLADLEITEKQLMEHYNKCVAETAKEKADVDNLKQPNVRSFFQDQSLYDNTMSKEQEEYLEALNKQEVTQKEYVGVKEQREQLAKDVAEIQKEADEINQLYRDQDEMLGGFFNGNYGSAEENRLESELDMLTDRKQRVLIAKQKWQNGRVLIHHACSQLAFGLQRWQWIVKLDPRNMPFRYQVATEARNNFIAASQNIANCQRYLTTIALPYLKPQEIEILNKATQHIYVDMQSVDRYNHATECYTITHRRCAALLQWFDHVIDNTIMSDLNTASQQAADRQKALRSERLRLLQEKYTQNSGETIDLLDQGKQHKKISEGPDAELDEDDKQLMALTEADKVSMAGEIPQGDGETQSPDMPEKEPNTVSLTVDEPARQPTPLPLADLAPPPSEEEIFGNMESLKKQHEQQMLEFQKAQETNRTRMEQGLQEKLRARRSRRARQSDMEE